MANEKSRMLDLFIKQYVARLYGKRDISLDGSPTPEQVLREAINLHEKVCTYSCCVAVNMITCSDGEFEIYCSFVWSG